MLTDILTIWSDSPALSLAIWLVIAVTVLYLGRPHAHQLLRGTGRAARGAMRGAAASIRLLEQRVMVRNRDVLLARGREAAEKVIEREFSRINAIVERDLGQYPALHRRLSDTLQKVETDYQAATADAPLPPAWAEVVETLSALPASGDPAVTRILDNIKGVVEDSHRETLKAWQQGANERHRILSGMQPEWRALGATLERVHRSITGLEDRAKTIDRHMADYASMRDAEDKAVNTLAASSVTQFFIASLVLVIATFGGIINFHLIALPMSEMVGGANHIGDVRVSDIAALVIIMVEITMGLFLLEALQVTRLFPMVASMDDRMRRRMGIAAFTILVIFAGIEASLAYMRDLLALDREALQQSLAGVAVAEAQFRWIPSIGQMVLGFVLPFALAFVAIPLEAFVHSARTVLGLVALGVLRTLRVAVRTTGGLCDHLSKMLVSLYDLVIMLPLGIERMITHYRSGGHRATARAADPYAGESDVAREHGAARTTRRRRKRTEDERADGVDDDNLAAREV